MAIVLRPTIRVACLASSCVARPFPFRRPCGPFEFAALRNLSDLPVKAAAPTNKASCHARPNLFYFFMRYWAILPIDLPCCHGCSILSYHTSLGDDRFQQVSTAFAAESCNTACPSPCRVPDHPSGRIRPLRSLPSSLSPKLMTVSNANYHQIADRPWLQASD